LSMANDDGERTHRKHHAHRHAHRIPKTLFAGYFQ